MTFTTGEIIEPTDREWIPIEERWLMLFFDDSKYRLLRYLKLQKINLGGSYYKNQFVKFNCTCLISLKFFIF